MQRSGDRVFFQLHRDQVRRRIESMMKHRRAGWMSIGLAFAIFVVAAGPTAAGDVPAYSADDAVAATDPGAEAARAVVADLLRDRGLTEDQVQERLAALTDEDVLQLSRHVEQIQEGGAVPNYIWILLAVLIGVTILATI
jgi:hypothetical protein